MGSPVFHSGLSRQERHVVRWLGQVSPPFTLELQSRFGEKLLEISVESDKCSCISAVLEGIADATTALEVYGTNKFNTARSVAVLWAFDQPGDISGGVSRITVRSALDSFDIFVAGVGHGVTHRTNAPCYTCTCSSTATLQNPLGIT